MWSKVLRAQGFCIARFVLRHDHPTQPSWRNVLDEYEGLHKAGRFAIDEVTEVEGELILRGPQSTLDLFSNSPFHTHGLLDGSIAGTFFDRSKVSLLSCITTQGPGSGHDRSGQRFHTASVFPHLVIFGDESIAASDQKVRSVHFIIEDAHAIFYDWDAFGEFDGDAAHLSDLIKKNGRKEASFSADNGHPQIYYYTGKYTIFKAQTLLGEVSASHDPTITHGVRGTQIKDWIRLNIEFPDTLTADAAMNRYFVLLRFIELVCGRRQNLERLSFGVDVGGSTMRALQEVYVCHRPRYDRFNDDRGPSPADLPMMAANEPQAFGEALRRYIERDEEWLTARVRFAPSLEAGRVYSTDRLIGAANMFDVLPDSAFALPPPLPADVAAAKVEARKIFKALPFSAEKDSVLGALGRLGTLTLRQKVYARSALVTCSGA